MIHQYENQRAKGYRIVHDLVFYTNDLKRFSGKIHFSSPHYKIVNKPFLFSPFQKKIEEYKDLLFLKCDKTIMVMVCNI